MTLRHVWRGHRATVLAFVLAALLTVFLGARFTVHAVYWSRHRDDALAEWMTLGYVAQSWHVERDDLASSLGVEPAAARRMTLAELARLTGRPVAEVEAELQASIAAARASPEAGR